MSNENLTQEIFEGTKIIMEFTGRELQNNIYDTISAEFPFYRPETIEDLDYSSSWDAQIPAWAKLVAEIQKHVAYYGPFKIWSISKRYQYLECVSQNNPLAGFNIIVQSIRWYQQHIEEAKMNLKTNNHV